jgi:GGDEF domain-containing protein
MKYTQFEQLVLGAGGIAILATTLLSVGQGFDPLEFGGQLLLIAVLIGAVHWGRRGGLIAATAASLIYIALRIPLILQTGASSDIILMLLARILAFGLVGIVGGEVCTRIMYVFARLQDANGIDDWSGVYGQRLAARQLAAAVERCRRYGEPFCIVTVALSPSLTSDLQDSGQRALVRGVADHIRNDVRMVDEVSRLDDGRFLVLLPHAPKDGGVVVQGRLARDVPQVVGARDGSVETRCLAGVEDATEVDALLADIAPVVADQDAESVD